MPLVDPTDKASPVEFYCSNALCRKASSAAARPKMGYTDVKVMASGIKGSVATRLRIESSAS